MYNVDLHMHTVASTHAYSTVHDYIAAAVGDSGGMISLGTDAHSAFALGDFSACLPILQEAAFPEERILNASPWRVLAFLERHGGERIAEIDALLNGAD